MAVHFSPIEPETMSARTTNARVYPTVKREVFISTTCAETARQCELAGARPTTVAVPWEETFRECFMRPDQATDAALALWILGEGDATFRDNALALWWAARFADSIPLPPDLDRADTAIRERVALMPIAGETR